MTFFLGSVTAIAFAAQIIYEVWKAPADPNDQWHKEAVDFRKEKQ